PLGGQARHLRPLRTIPHPQRPSRRSAWAGPTANHWRELRNQNPAHSMTSSDGEKHAAPSHGRGHCGSWWWRPCRSWARPATPCLAKPDAVVLASPSDEEVGEGFEVAPAGVSRRVSVSALGPVVAVPTFKPFRQVDQGGSHGRFL